MTTLEVLQGARTRIERGWAQGAYATNAHGKPVSSNAPEARAWCLSGAIRVVGGDQFSESYKLLQRCASTQVLCEWNDASHRTKEEVLAVLDKAIAEASK